MINTQLFRRHYAITVVVILSFFALGFLISNSLMNYARNRAAQFGNSEPDIFFAHLIDDSQLKDRVQAIQHLKDLSGGSLPFKLVILNSGGEDLSYSQAQLPFNWSEIEKPKLDYQVTVIKNPSNDGPPPGFLGKIVKFPGEPVQYLFITPDFQRGPPGPPRPSLSLLLVTMGSLLTFVLIGIGFALYLIFTSIRKKIHLADQVIFELQNGNLKARIPITRMDELGLAMGRFNKMAEEIERLVEQLRHVEKSRRMLLQDLTHDLRTPVASLKNLLVTIEKKSLESDQAVRSELLSISRKEVEYFERLVEDLLVLAQISEPRYQANQESVSVADLIEEEILSFSGKGTPDEKKIEIIQTETAFVSGDGHLLHRLFRNALENALSFAKTGVKISIQIIDAKSIQILIQDDGPGFSAEGLTSFGERKISRVMAQTKGNRLSVGLGSVIMKTVAEIHSGKMNVSNLTSASGVVTGASVEIILPLVQA